MKDIFEQKIYDNLVLAGINLEKSNRIGVAVSGGADSVSLLVALCNLCKEKNTNLYVVNVNHFIRSEEETTGDSRFVEDLCKQLKKQGFNLEVKVYNLKKGQVEELSRKRKNGTEDAARVLRYECFSDFIGQKKLDYLCLAHNQNDQLETLLMRFLQGSRTDNAKGISLVRDRFVRPLLNVLRQEIEEYLKRKNIDYRTDSTNQDTSYLRNRIRYNLIPVLNQNFPGWQNSVLNGAQKNAEDTELIEEILQNYDISREGDGIVILRQDFHSAKKAVKIRLLLKAFDMLIQDYRVPGVFLDDVIKAEEAFKGGNNEIKKQTALMEVIISEKTIRIKKSEQKNSDFNFSVIIEEDCILDLPFAEISVTSQEKNKEIVINKQISEVFIEYPFILRSIQPLDNIKTADNKYKKVAKIYSDWHVPEEIKPLIPVIQRINSKEQLIECILGKALGFYDWIVK